MSAWEASPFIIVWPLRLLPILEEAHGVGNPFVPTIGWECNSAPLYIPNLQP